MLAAFVVPIVFFCLGCGPKTRDVAPVNGHAFLDDKPMTRGYVGTLPTSGRGASGNINPDGTFELHTFSAHDGALLGTHKVGVVAYDESGQRSPESEYGKLLVPKRYTNPETSGFTIDVPEDGLDDVELKLYTKEQK